MWVYFKLDLFCGAIITVTITINYSWFLHLKTTGRMTLEIMVFC
jgi:hypothetical protein